MIDLYDSEVAALGKVIRKLMEEWSHKPNTRNNLEELTRRAHDECLKVGLVIELDTTPCLIARVDPATGSITYGSPELVVMGRSSTSKLANLEQGVHVLDHERKREEVLLSKERGEDFAGQKFKNKV